MELCPGQSKKKKKKKSMEFKTVLGKAGPSGEEKVPKPQLNHYSAQS